MLTTFPLASPAAEATPPAPESGAPTAGVLFRNILGKLGFPVTSPVVAITAAAPPEAPVAEAAESGGDEPAGPADFVDPATDSADPVAIASTVTPPAPVAVETVASSVTAPPIASRKGMDSTLPQAVLESRLLVARVTAPPALRGASIAVSGPVPAVDPPRTDGAPVAVAPLEVGLGSVPGARPPAEVAVSATGVETVPRKPRADAGAPLQPPPVQPGFEPPPARSDAPPVAPPEGAEIVSATPAVPVAKPVPAPAALATPAPAPTPVLSKAAEGSAAVSAASGAPPPAEAEGTSDPLPFILVRPSRVLSPSAASAPPPPGLPLRTAPTVDLPAPAAPPTVPGAPLPRAIAAARQPPVSIPAIVSAAPTPPAIPVVVASAPPPPPSAPPTIAQAVLAVTPARPMLPGGPLLAGFTRADGALTGKPDPGLPDAPVIDPARPETHRIETPRPEHAKPGAPIPLPLARQIAEAVPPADGPGFDLSLSPEELGQVRLRLVSIEGGSLLMIQAERPETLDLLRRHIGSLEQDLIELGHEGLELHFSSGGGPQGESRHDPPPQHSAAPGPAAIPARAQSRETPAPLATASVSGRDHLDLRL